MAETAARNGLASLALTHEIEQFFFAEADLLDDRRFPEWLDLFTDDVRYFMPLVRNVRLGDEAQEHSREQQDTAWMDEGKETLGQRVRQLMTGIHWAEEPRSRMSHLLTNLRILKAEPDYDNPTSVQTRCRFILYRNRLQDEVDILVGKRSDTLTRVDGSWKIARREILLDQNVLLAKNLTTFF
jgi:3-phenylpropionate/cinnamic acid dioxygenase small subunit